MKHGAVAVRYAKALFSLAQDKKVLDEVCSDMQNIARVVDEHPKFSIFMESPVVKTSHKVDLLHEVFKEKVHAIVSSFLDLLVEKNRQDYLSAVCKAFLAQYKAHKGYKEVLLTTAVEPSEDMKKNISVKVKDKFGVEVELRTMVDAEVIGGFMLRIDDMLLDRSIATKLNDMKKKLLSK